MCTGCPPARAAASAASPLPAPPCPAPALQPSDKSMVVVRCDARLRELFGADAVELPRMAQALKAHLQPLEPVTLHFTVK